MKPFELLPNGEHFQVFQDIPVNEMSPMMHAIGKQIGSTTFELGLIGYGDSEPIRIHSESIYHPQMCPYFMLACVQRADSGGDTIIYDGEKAAKLITEEMPELQNVTMVYHAEHYNDTSARVPLLRNFRDKDVLAFRQKFPLNEAHGLPEGMNEDELYEYVDGVLDRCVEFEKILDPGEVILVDNYRTLHVRKAYSGLRKIIRVRVDDPAYQEAR